MSPLILGVIHTVMMFGAGVEGTGVNGGAAKQVGIGVIECGRFWGWGMA